MCTSSPIKVVRLKSTKCNGKDIRNEWMSWFFQNLSTYWSCIIWKTQLILVLIFVCVGVGERFNFFSHANFNTHLTIITVTISAFNGYWVQSLKVRQKSLLACSFNISSPMALQKFSPVRHLRGMLNTLSQSTIFLFFDTC